MFAQKAQDYCARAVALHAPTSSDPVLPPARHADPLLWNTGGSWAPPAAEYIQCALSSPGD